MLFQIGFPTGKTFIIIRRDVSLSFRLKVLQKLITNYNYCTLALNVIGYLGKIVSGNLNSHLLT